MAGAGGGSGGSRRYELTFELAGQIDPRIIRSFTDLSRDVALLEQNLDELRRTRPIPDDVPDSIRDITDRAREFGDVFQRALDFTGAKAIIDGVTGAFGNMINDVGELEESLFKVQAATGASAEEMKSLDDSIRGMYEANYGEGFGDIADSLVNVKNATGLTGQALKDATESALSLRDVFGYEVNETMRTVGVMMKNLGITSEEAFNLIAQGSQKGLNRADDFLDTLNEYSVQFKDAGYNAQQMLSVLNSGMEKGSFNTDKTADALKEFRIRIMSGDKAVVEAMDGLFAMDGIEKFTKNLAKGGQKTKEFQQLVAKTSKTTAATMLKTLQSGKGTQVAKMQQTISSVMSDSQKVFNGLSNGSIKARDALQMVNDKLLTIDDLQQRNALSVSLFGTQYEDMGSGITQALNDVNGEFDKNLNTMEDIKKLNMESFSKQLQGLGREIMTEIVIPIGEELLPMLHEMVDWAKDNKDFIEFVALSTPAALIGKNVTVLGKGLWGLKGKLIEAAGAGGLLSKSLAFMKSPAGIAVGAVGLLTAGLIAYQEHQEAVRESMINMGDELKTAFDDYNTVDKQRDKLTNLIKEYDRLKAKIDNAKTPANELAEAQRKIADIEKQIIDQSDGYITAQDAKTNALREQAGAQLDLYNNMAKASEQEARFTILDKEAQLPDLLKEYDNLQSKEKELNKAQESSGAVLTKLIALRNKYDEVMSNTPAGSKRDEQLKGLNDELKTLMNYDQASLANLEQFIGTARTTMLKTKDDLKTNEKEMAASKASLDELYNARYRMIEVEELNGESLKQLTNRYNTLSTEARKKVDEAAKRVQELNKEFASLPTSKQIDVTVDVKQKYGPMAANNTFPNVYTEVKDKTDPKKSFSFPVIPPLKPQKFAYGGIVTSPTLGLVGEAGDDEAIIPLNNSKRSRDLYAAAGSALGMDGGGHFAPVFSPQIVIQGNADEKVIQKSMRDSHREWLGHMENWQRQNRRRSMV
ncbi:phage tail tape measure protein [Paenibacillus kribbensis]|uniref:phage tail tape measure protein n=1 Tax=Paenibacillus kribbensis TaxID=172713 RepID=UPI002DBD310E|nr:phage tail tape measure protein [Paenibacillus kribbensis]MEC0234077.1 phage tail tape measure protein [Paenibacillus kribbensis]